jgi:A/G-specific adenine glycosylase
MQVMPQPPWIDDLIAWYDGAARSLPWRGAHVSPYAVLVSEVMLQQTPVARVVPAFEAWLDRWPTPAALAADSPGEAVRMWGRLGYPRRALRLHEACREVVTRYAGELPTTVPELLSLPGVGEYTARAVAVFSLQQRHPVVDTNVRRVVARVVDGVADRAASAKDLCQVEALLPSDAAEAGKASIALMEHGALVCTARAPRCGVCAVADHCRWLASGAPELEAPVRKAQGYAGTDRQVRGRLLAVLRDSADPVARELLDQVWDDADQRDRSLAGLITDGLVVEGPDGRLALPQ